MKKFLFLSCFVIVLSFSAAAFADVNVKAYLDGQQKIHRLASNNNPPEPKNINGQRPPEPPKDGKRPPKMSGDKKPPEPKNINGKRPDKKPDDDNNQRPAMPPELKNN